MLTIITGVPGSGKSLYALTKVTEGRPPRIRENVRFINFDVHDRSKIIEITELRKQAPGTVVVVDEAQKFFGPRSPSASLPEYQDLAEHRHDGIDVILITQHPSQLDARYRRLASDHYHVVRVFGTDSARVHHWGEIHEDVSARGDSDSSVWIYDKALYSLYHSADLHTGKARVPKKLIFGAAALLLVPLLGWFAYRKLMNPAAFGGAAASAASVAKGSPVRPGPLPELGASRPARKPLTGPEYMLSRTPVVATMPQTAPAYQKLARPQTFPIIAGCVEFSGHCTCYTQQATPYAIDAASCHAFLRHLPFLDAEPPPLRERPAFVPASQPSPVPSAPRVVAQPVMQFRPPVVERVAQFPDAGASSPRARVPSSSPWRFRNG